MSTAGTTQSAVKQPPSTLLDPKLIKFLCSKFRMHAHVIALLSYYFSKP